MKPVVASRPDIPVAPIKVDVDDVSNINGPVAEILGDVAEAIEDDAIRVPLRDEALQLSAGSAVVHMKERSVDCVTVYATNHRSTEKTPSKTHSPRGTKNLPSFKPAMMMVEWLQRIHEDHQVSISFV